MPPTVALSAKGFANEELARQLGHAVVDAISVMGSFIDLAKVDSIDRWEPSLETFAPLEEFAKDVFNSGGLNFISQGDGSRYIDVPFTLETMF